MKTFIYRTFHQWAKREGISDSALKKAIGEIEKGLFDANLGQGLYKQRVARKGQGKRGGYRTILAFKEKDRCVFMYGFAKNDRANIGDMIMTTAKKAKHPTMLEVAHEMANGLYEANIIDATTMREFDTMCLAPVKELTPKDIKKIRLREKVSQPVFAKCLNTSTSTIKQWEQGEKHPRGTSLKLLNLVAEKGLSILIA